MKKLIAILFGTFVLISGAAIVYGLVKRNSKEPLKSGLYTFNIFRKIAGDIDKDIADTEKRLAKHDELQKMYNEMEWNTSNN